MASMAHASLYVSPFPEIHTILDPVHIQTRWLSCTIDKLNTAPHSHRGHLWINPTTLFKSLHKCHLLKHTPGLYGFAHLPWRPLTVLKATDVFLDCRSDSFSFDQRRTDPLWHSIGLLSVFVNWCSFGFLPLSFVACFFAIDGAAMQWFILQQSY